jgi:hypothetical protein
MLASRSAATAQERLALLNCRRLPGRLNTSEAALLLGFQEYDIAPLIAVKLLVPLGKAAPNSPKYFAAVEIAERASLRSFISLCHCRVESKSGRIQRVKYWEIIADNLSKAGWSWGCVSAVDSQGRTQREHQKSRTLLIAGSLG